MYSVEIIHYNTVWKASIKFLHYNGHGSLQYKRHNNTEQHLAEVNTYIKQESLQQAQVQDSTL